MADILLQDPSDIIHAVTEPVRWKILKCLQVQKTAKQVAEELELKPALAQYHLKRLVAAGVVEEFPHPNFKRRLLYIRRTMEGAVSVRDRHADAKVRIY